MSSTPSQRSPLEVRRARGADWDDIFAADARAFLMTSPMSDAERSDLRGKVDDSEVVVVRDPAATIPDPLVGVAMFYQMTMTVPGGDALDAAGLSWVSVAATHRRRGILRTMITELFEQWEAQDKTFAILTASEATIYERFGFGPACFADRVDIDLSRTRMRAQPDGSSPVVFGTTDEIARRIPELHRRWTQTRPGALARPDSWWAPILADRDSQRPPHSSGLHYLLHADGYASYRINNSVSPSRGDVEEVIAVTEEAHTELWRVLTGLDLLSCLHAPIPVDDPLPVKLTDHRTVRIVGHDDKMWLRILDVPRALSSRRYSDDVDVVLEITDEFRSSGGTFVLSARNGGGIAAPSELTPTARMDISVLAMIYLGGTRARTLAAAGRLWTDSPATLEAFDRAFATDRAPFSGTFF